MNQAWTKFTKRIVVKAPVKTIYHAWATQHGLEKWFLRVAQFTTQDGQPRPADEFIQPHDAYQWLWHGYSDDGCERNVVLEANGQDVVKFGFSGCYVSVAMSDVGGETMVELTQENIPLEENPSRNLYVACGEGWTFYLANLKSVLEGGIDLRNKDVNTKGVINS